MNRLSAIIIAITAACCAMFVPQPAAAQESIYTYEWVVEPKFENYGNFSEGLAAVKINDKWGYIDKTGKIVIEPKFQLARDFNEGIAVVSTNGRYGTIDKKGEFIITPRFNYVLNFCQGLATVKVNSKYGVINKTGKVVIQPIFDDTFSFNEGLAAVKVNGKYGIINTKGEFTITPKFNYIKIKEFSEGLAIIKINSSYGFIDKTGKVVIQPMFDDAFSFNEGLAAVRLNGKWGYIDKTGKVVITPIFDSAGSFSEGLVNIKQNDKWGYIDKTGKIVIEPMFDYTSIFSDGLATIKQNNKWGYIDKTGKIVIESMFDNAGSFTKGLANIKRNDKWGFIDRTGTIIIEPMFDLLGSFYEELVFIKLGQKWGFIKLFEIKNTLDGYVKAKLKPMISAADYIKPKVERDINVWQQKGEFESTALWQQRVNEQSRYKKIEELTAKYRAEYNAMLEQYKEEYKNTCQQYYALKEKPKRAAFDSSSLVLSTYDADNQSFMITSKTAFADILLSVPVAEAPSFKQNWNTIKTTAELKYMPSGDDVALTSVSFYNGTKKYTYDGTSDIKYAITDIDYNFRPIEIALSNDNNIDYDFDPIGNAGGSVVQSPAAKDLADNKNRIDHRKLSAGTSSDVDNNIPKTAETNKNTFAVIIANETYRREANVDFALNDGKVFRQYCHNTLGIPESNIRYIENATLNDMKVDINWITEVAKAYKGEAQIIFYYAGHGIPDEQSGAAYLLPVDGYGSDLSTGYSLGDLYEKFSDAPAKSTVLLLDACFSGAKRGGGMMTSARGVAIKAKAAQPGGNLIVFSAAQGDETAYPYTEKGHGMFTYFLLKKLQDSKGEASLSEIGDYIIDNVRRESIVRNQKSQTPTVTTSLSIGPVWKSLKLK